jgi:hypothetical protein
MTSNPRDETGKNVELRFKIFIEGTHAEDNDNVFAFKVDRLVRDLKAGGYNITYQYALWGTESQEPDADRSEDENADS